MGTDLDGSDLENGSGSHMNRSRFGCPNFLVVQTCFPDLLTDQSNDCKC